MSSNTNFDDSEKLQFLFKRAFHVPSTFENTPWYNETKGKYQTILEAEDINIQTPPLTPLWIDAPLDVNEIQQYNQKLDVSNSFAVSSAVYSELNTKVDDGNYYTRSGSLSPGAYVDTTETVMLFVRLKLDKMVAPDVNNSIAYTKYPIDTSSNSILDNAFQFNYNSQSDVPSGPDSVISVFKPYSYKLEYSQDGVNFDKSLDPTIGNWIFDFKSGILTFSDNPQDYDSEINLDNGDLYFTFVKYVGARGLSKLIDVHHNFDVNTTPGEHENQIVVDSSNKNIYLYKSGKWISVGGKFDVSGTTIYYSDGNVGIGTETPSASNMLEVSGNTHITNGNLTVDNDIHFSGSLYQNGTVFGSGGSGGSGGSAFDICGTSAFYTNGSVGIGLENPDVNNALEVSGNTHITHGNLTVDNDISFSGLLYQNGELFKSGTFDICGTSAFYTDGNVGIGLENPDVNNALEVSGNTHITNGNLNVDNDISFSGLLYQNGELFKSGTFDICGTSAFYTDGSVGIGVENPDVNNALEVSGNTHITNGNLTVDNSTNLIGTVVIGTDSHDTTKALYVGGDTEITGSLNIGSITDIEGKVNTLDTSVNALELHNTVVDASVNQLEVITTDIIYSSNATTFANDVSVNGDVSINNNLIVNNDIHFSGSLYQNGTVFGSVIKTFDICGTSAFYTDGNVGIGLENPSTSNALEVSGNTQITNGSLNVDNDISFSGLLYQNGELFKSGTFDICGTSAFYTDGSVGIGVENPDVNNALEVSGNTQITNGSLNVDNDISFSGLLYQNGELFKSGTFDICGTSAFYTDGNVGIGVENPDVNNALEVSGNTQITNGNLTINNDLIVNNSLEVSGNTQITNGNFTVDNSTNLIGTVVIGTDIPDTTKALYVEGDTEITGLLKIGSITDIEGKVNTLDTSVNALETHDTVVDASVNQLEVVTTDITYSYNRTIFANNISVSGGGNITSDLTVGGTTRSEERFEFFPPNPGWNGTNIPASFGRSADANICFISNANRTGFNSSKIVLRRDDGNFYGAEILGGLHNGSPGATRGLDDLAGTECFAINQVGDGNKTRRFTIDRNQGTFIDSKLRVNESVGIGRSVSSFKLDVNGTIRTTGNVNTSSDDRIKFNETDISSSAALQAIDQLVVKEYDKIMTYPNDISGTWIPTDIEWAAGTNVNFTTVKEIGIIAQDLKQISMFAKYVTGEEVDASGNQTPLSVNYQAIFCTAISAIQDLKVQVDALKAELQMLRT